MANPKNILVMLFNRGECIWKERFHPCISRGSWDILGWYHSVAKLWLRVHTANAVSRHFWSAALFGATCVYSSTQQGRGACLGQLGGRAGRSAWAIWRQPPIWTARRYEDPGGQVQCDYCGRRAWCLRQRWFRSGQKTWGIRGDGSCPEALLIGRSLSCWQQRREPLRVSATMVPVPGPNTMEWQCRRWQME